MAFAPKTHRAAPAECPVCGAAVPRNAHACPECGADERTGWNEEDTRYDGLDLPDHAFGENDSVGSPPGSTPRHVNGIALHWWLLAVLLLAAVIFGFVRIW